MGVETGGCPHTAIREDAPMNLAAIEEEPEISTCRIMLCRVGWR